MQTYVMEIITVLWPPSVFKLGLLLDRNIVSSILLKFAWIAI